MNTPATAPGPEAAPAAATSSEAAGAPPPAAGPSPGVAARWLLPVLVLLAALAAGALALAWTARERVKLLESELVKRQADSGAAATEARVLARQAETTARESAARLALLEARVAETVLQRTQVEELIQSLARSRDENVLADVDAAVRVALQQSAITGSAEPLLLVLRQADERLARYNQPRLERVRRAIAQDLERARNAGVTDLSALAIRLDEIVRQVDDLPLLVAPVGRGARRPGEAAAAAAPATPASVAGVAATTAGERETWSRRARALWDSVVHEARSLVRVTRIDEPEAMLVAPEQAYFLRENHKLRLLNARLALLSRQFDTAQSDLREALAALDRYFERGARRTAQAADALRQVAAQARTVSVPRPDATLAAIATASAGR